MQEGITGAKNAADAKMQIYGETIKITNLRNSGN
jgi:hypothetical protein